MNNVSEENIILTTLENQKVIEREGILSSLDNIRSITEKLRSNIVDWLMPMYKYFKLTLNSWFATINILDAYLGREILRVEGETSAVREENISIEQFPLVAVTSMLLAAKYNEIYHPDLNDIVFASYFIVTNSVVMESSDSAKSIITKKSIKETEKKIYTIL